MPPAEALQYRAAQGGAVMKKAFLAAAVVVLAFVSFILMFMRGKSISAGICLEADNGCYLILRGDEPIVMNSRVGGESPFSGLHTGDKIWIVHDGIEETYPSRTGVYACLRTGGGDGQDLSPELIEQLRSLGWVPLV